MRDGAREAVRREDMCSTPIECIIRALANFHVSLHLARFDSLPPTLRLNILHVLSHHISSAHHALVVSRASVQAPQHQSCPMDDDDDDFDLLDSPTHCAAHSPTPKASRSIWNRPFTERQSRTNPTADPLHPSPFDDLPPVQRYDPSFPTAPFRSEPAPLGPPPINTPSHRPVLPSVFKLANSSDLEEDDEHATDANSSSQHQPQLSALNSANLFNSPTNPDNPPDAQKVGAFQSSRSLQDTIADFKLLLTRDFESQLASVKTAEHRSKFAGQPRTKTAEMRIKVPMVVKASTSNYTIVINLEERAHVCNVLIRRSFPDTFRLSNEDFDWFCTDVKRRFYQLRAAK